MAACRLYANIDHFCLRPRLFLFITVLMGPYQLGGELRGLVNNCKKMPRSSLWRLSTLCA